MKYHFDLGRYPPQQYRVGILSKIIPFTRKPWPGARSMVAIDNGNDPKGPVPKVGVGIPIGSIVVPCWEYLLL